MTNYYDAVVNTARMIGNPRVSKKQLVKVLSRIADAVGQKLDDVQLNIAYQQFAQAHTSKYLA